MSDEQNLDATTPSVDQDTPDNTFNDLLDGIKDGERQKYNSVEDALSSINPSQDHIKNLEAENAELKSNAEKMKTMEEMMAKLEERAKISGDQPTDKQVFDESKIDEILDARLNARDAQKTASDKIQSVISVFESKFGTKAESEYSKAVNDAGLSHDAMRNLIISNPKSALKLMGVEEIKTQAQPSLTKTTFNATANADIPNIQSVKVPMIGSTSEMLADAWRATAKQ